MFLFLTQEDWLRGALNRKNGFATINKKRVNQHILGGSKLILGEMLNN